MTPGTFLPFTYADGRGVVVGDVVEFSDPDVIYRFGIVNGPGLRAGSVAVIDSSCGGCDRDLSKLTFVQGPPAETSCPS